MINVGIVGLGFMGVTHIKAYRKIQGVRIAGICDAVRLPVDGDFSKISGNIGDSDPVKLDMSQVKATKNMDDLLKDPSIDLIDLCVPTLAHAKLAVTALKAGKHVMCEKPMARNATQAREIADAAASAKGFFMPGMCLRFWPEWAWVKKAMDNKAYGRVLAARFRRVGTVPTWGKEHFLDGTKSGGALLDLHIHDTDFVQFCFGRPKAVFSTGFTLLSGAIDHVVTQYQVESGACVSAEGGWVMTDGFSFNMAYTFIFENATVDYDLTRGADALRLFEKGQSPRTIKCEGGDGYIGELSHMVECINTKRPPSIVTARDGQSAVEICEAEEKSIKTGKLVRL
ncbi:MAG: Gfo/Idh/MocA family oxidoreductase [Kiritimatiellae bacterium]|nr:Gfo/Idh/MocA family oxidoreductase [Kiritimatiellia bacterium]MDD5522317.1 Gfo/Idh/MocA family oxidoreductase [Kiritimatiellia bacterium]